VLLGLSFGSSACVAVGATAAALVVVLLGLPLGLVLGAMTDFGDRAVFFRACFAVCAGLWDLALVDFLGLPTGLLGDSVGVVEACCSPFGAVVSFRGLPRPLVTVAAVALDGEFVTSDCAVLRADFLAVVGLYVGSPMLDRFGRPEAWVSEVSGSPMIEVPPMLTFLRFDVDVMAPAVAGRFLGGIVLPGDDNAIP
jgi:hypothetical protein